MNRIKTAEVDVAIFGGGIAGLYTLNRLKSLGFSVALFESNTLGGGQTIHSQGIIHGGLKFALTGMLTASANAVERMPIRWQNCLAGKGELDLSKVQVLSRDQLLWSTGSLSSQITGFFASKSLSSRVKKVKPSDFPKIFQTEKFRGQVWRLEEIVLNIPSLIEVLSNNHSDSLFKINDYEIILNDTVYCAGRPQPNADIQQPKAGIQYIKIQQPSLTLHLSAKRYLFSAGEGNLNLGATLHNFPEMQCRPLQMVIVKMEEYYPLYAHCIDQGMNPRVTITTHHTIDGKYVWYIGGQLAEDGAHRTKDAQLEITKKELESLFPWIDWNKVEFSSFYINRAEARQPDGKRPDSLFLCNESNYSVAWPTKLALAPMLADRFITSLEDRRIEASIGQLQSLQDCMEKPKIALPAWDRKL